MVINSRTVGAIALASIGLTLSLTLPLAAQDIDAPTPVEPEAPFDDETGLPDVGEPGADDRQDEASTVTDNIIIIDGTAYEYDPADLEGNPILDNLSPVDNQNLNLEMNDEAGRDDGADSGGMVTYPPADSIEDLEPADILSE
jgi:hypothetical protein